MKIICLIGKDSNQISLVNKINAKFPVSGVVIEERKSINIERNSIFFYLKKIISKILFYKIDSAWYNLLSYYKKDAPKLVVSNVIITNYINSHEIITFLKNQKPDLIIVSGTSLIKKEILELQVTSGILNLHTGLSPYIKGGPNCTNWCLSINKPEFIGNTIMWIDAGIDSGNIFFTEKTDISKCKSFNHLHLVVMEHAHELYIRAIDQLIKGNLNNVPQDEIAKGKVFYTKEWGFRARFNLLLNLINLKKRLSKKINENNIVEINKILD